jgi:predicted Zn-dependent protease
MKPLLSSEVQTLDAAQKIAGLSAPLFNWAEELATVALDAASERPDVAARASGTFEELLAQFTGETGEVRRELEADRGELLFRGGRPEDGERVLRRVIAAHPAHAVGYATLAREWTRSEAAGRADLQRALALLDEAAQRRVEDAGLWELSARRKELRERLAAAGAAP